MLGIGDLDLSEPQQKPLCSAELLGQKPKYSKPKGILSLTLIEQGVSFQQFYLGLASCADSYECIA